ncbi:GNAT family N-acetyltransferase [Nesterenkonia alba]|uniref:GNAT family N-acetyltransferase n=1 Tax=Nesterenkonia alba TaxID=515814 RepID=UPI0003B430A9|nr:GNAT family N-acetyltransferase [Nesterenkonia alba]
MAETTMGATAPATELVIRPAEPPDFQRIADITVRAYIDGGFLRAQDPYLEHLTAVEHRAEKARVLVAEAQGAVAGTVTVTDHHGEYAEVSRPGEMEFRMLAVAPEFQGRGIGRSLVRHIVAEAQTRPEITAVTLCSLQSMTGAHALYRSEGFVEDPLRDFVLAVPEKQARFPFFIRKVTHG